MTVIHRLPYSAINFWAYERITEMWRQHVPTEKSNSSLEFSRRLVAGGLAGAMACTAVRVFLQALGKGNMSTAAPAEPANNHILLQAYPLDLVRTRLSAQVSNDYYKGIGSTLKTIVRDEGVGGLYRGLNATLLQVAPSLAINYAAYESLRAYFMAKHPEQQSPTVSLAMRLPWQCLHQPHNEHGQLPERSHFCCRCGRASFAAA